jgi:hypothetical protein
MIINKNKGVPLQFTTDCGSETTQLHGLANALRWAFLHGVGCETVNQLLLQGNLPPGF